MASLNAIEPASAFPTDDEKIADKKMRDEGRAHEIPFRQDRNKDGLLKWEAICTYTTQGMFSVESETVTVSFHAAEKPAFGPLDSSFVYFVGLHQSVNPAAGKKRGAFNLSFSAESMLMGADAARAFLDAITTEAKQLEALKTEYEVLLGTTSAPAPAAEAPKASSNGKAKAGVAS